MHRIKKLLKSFEIKGIDGYFISSVPNITYLTGFTGDSSILILLTDRSILITDERYTEQAGIECHKEIEILNWINGKRYGIETYNHIIKRNQIKRLGFEGNVLTYNAYKVLKEGLTGVEILSFDDIIENLRMLKEEEEISYLKKACSISDRALELTLPYIKTGITESELAAKIEYNMKINGAEALSFETIVLSGKRTSLLHGKPGQKKLENGDFILFDFGATYSGYHADISRTFILGSMDNQQRELYKIVQKAQIEAIQSIKPGLNTRIPEKIIKENIPEKYLPYFYPGFGHGVGLQIHESPFLGRDLEYIFENKMALTIEPGIYIPGWGGLRIEDTLAVRENSVELLSNFSRELMIL